ncbi:site-specific integrase [Herbaspirillum frisingense]|uniref:site-specific integrase n=1 Tax=Herbaspirillum frisingense TaxID=92645 RepID=UPI0039B0ADAC
MPIRYRILFFEQKMINPRARKFLSDDVASLVEIIKKESEIDKISNATKANYDAEIRRTIAKLAARKQDRPGDFFAVLSETQSKATYYRRLAATNYFLRSSIVKLLNKLDAASADNEIFGICKSINFIAELKILMTQKAGLCEIKDPKPRVSKRNMLGGLSKDGDFREKLYEQFKKSKYQLAFLVMAVSGARPQELENGIHVRMDGRTLVIKIAGSKVKETQGQKVRDIEYEIDSTVSSFLLSEIARLIGTDASTGLIVAVDSKVNFTSALRRAGKAIWPNKRDVTPYVLRHAIASQWKQNLDPDDVSVALGHSSSKTRTRYGQAQLMKGAGSLAPNSVRGSRVIRTVLRSISPRYK